MKQDNNIAIEVLEAEITACEISRARKIVINENRKAAEMDKEITSLQHSIQTLSSTDKVIASGEVSPIYKGIFEVPLSEYLEDDDNFGKVVDLILREVK